jgi:hypothetical protein
MKWVRSLEFQHLQFAVPLVYKKQMGAEQCSLIISDVTSFDSGVTMQSYDVTYLLSAGLHVHVRGISVGQRDSQSYGIRIQHFK